ncbi:hypothetical protein V6N12_016215 [Hibiscus sabdariffa]|uniref:Retrotransposon gag protein n=1 Tax=Hibiscus sabdariffa TaxID=183260 RepID=A0ABR2CAL8_9ROSI
MAQISAYMARTDRFIQKTDAFMERTEMKLQNHDATLKSLETQVGQISQILNTRPIGGFPSDTEAIAATDKSAEVDEPAETSEDHYDPHNTSKGESSAKSSHTKPDKLEDIRPPPSFPQRLKKQKQDYQFKKFFDILKQVHINLPLVEALQQMPNYAKFLKDMVTRKKQIEEFEIAVDTETCLALRHNKVPAKKADPWSFTIECSIGHNYSTKALYCEADENAPIILRRPFLSTSRATIDFDKDEIVFKVDNEQIKMKALTKRIQPKHKDKGKGIDNTPTKSTQRPKLYMGAHTKRDKRVIFLRDA